MSLCACGMLYSVGSLNPLPGKVAQCHIKAVVFGNIRGEQSVHVVFPIPAHTHSLQTYLEAFAATCNCYTQG